MKANELMIGDWVRPIGCNPFRIGCVLGEMVCNESDTQSWCDDEIEPIPLTREILEKNGWKEAVLRHWNIEEDFALEKGEDGNMFWFLRGVSLVCSLNFVHELQHALRLCGIEKDIEL